MFYEINTKQAPVPIGPYVQGVDLGKIVIVSGQIPINPITGIIDKEIYKQTLQTLDNVKSIIEAAELHVKNIFKTTVFLKNINDIELVNSAYELFFIENKANFPARSCIEVSKLPKDVNIEIEAMAIRY
ncbi:reactive intermediate/imine deaminase [Candidatus Pantoea edessiphila]|uniref:Reactive intermediate/imine deaminase n=1 Tax=Candidatus Pantoea edessiphila TaxID=2044610 RepID=A0A2P5SY51_9GAMM|nr:Rid family detoxifying hydrolase [Candidatus Pantoea edessiphila]MBK4775630.1 reactive intermediate/imine deaminase [Pantoea sp. Edef]PPI87277.1 reactive intermediate/imine deaminase [Candidatus Pantoea edessiphila]